MGFVWVGDFVEIFYRVVIVGMGGLSYFGRVSFLCFLGFSWDLIGFSIGKGREDVRFI